MRYSIIIPVYNAEQYIDRCLESIIEQYDNQLEIILINDGSIDNSKKKCNDYQKKYSYISLINKKNEGPFAARIEGIKKAKGEYLLFVDSDDYISKKMIRCLDNIIDKKQPDIVIYDVCKDNNGNITDHKNNLFSSSNTFIDKEEVYKKLINKEMTNGLCSKCIKRDLVQINNKYETFKKVKMGEDLLQFLPFITNAKTVYYTDQKLYFYCVNESSLTRKYNPDYYYSLKIVNTEIEEYIKIWNFKNYQELIDERFIKDIIDIIKQISNCDKKYKKNIEIRKIINEKYYIEKVKKININSINFNHLYEKILCYFMKKRNMIMIMLFMGIYKIKSKIKWRLEK